VRNKLSWIDRSSLILDDLTKGSNCIILSMVVLLKLRLLVSTRSVILKGGLKSSKAITRDKFVGFTSILSHDTNTVRGSLSDGWDWRVAEVDDLLSNLRVVISKVLVTEEFNHIIEDEKSELLLLLLLVVDSTGKDLSEELSG
jgi:hypothetical protein